MVTTSPDTYEVYAVKYGTHARMRSENFIMGDPHEGPMPLDFYVWAIVAADRHLWSIRASTVRWRAKRKREIFRTPAGRLEPDRHQPGRGQGRHHHPHALRSTPVR